MNQYKLILLAYIMAISNICSGTGIIQPEQMQTAIEQMNRTHNRPLYENPPKYPEIDDKYYGIEGDRIYEYLARLTEFSQQSKKRGDFIWGRVQGSQSEKDATLYVASMFRQWGLEDVRVDSFPVTSGAWQPTSMSLDALNADRTVLRQIESAATAYPSGQTSVDGLVAPIEYVGMGTEADLRGRDLNGKIALVYVRTFSGVLLHSGLAAASRIANTTDAAGMILWIDLPGNGKFAAQLYSADGWIDNIPWINVGFHDGFYLRQLVERSTTDKPAQVRLKVRGQIETERKSQNLIGWVRGKSDENIIVTGHIDGFWNAMLDNGTGIASLMELARYYASADSKPKRNILFLVTGDHELEGAGGSAVFAHRYPEILRDSALVLQLEHLLAPNTSNLLNTLNIVNSSSPLQLFVSNGSSAVIDEFRHVIEDYKLVVNNNVQLNTLGDVDGISSVPSAGFIQTGHYYHNDQDELNLYHPNELAHITRAHAELIERFMTLPRSAFGAQEHGGTPIYTSEEMKTLLAPW